MGTCRSLAVALVLVIMAVGCQKVDRVERLTSILKNGNPEKVELAKKGLVKIGKDAVEPMIVLMKEGEPSVRVSAIEILAEIKDPRAVEPLIAALEGGSEVQIAAVEALGKMNDQRAVEPLIGLLSRDAGDVSSAVRIDAVRALVQLDGNRAVEPLIGLLSSDEQEVRSSAVSELARISPLSLGPLVASMSGRSMPFSYDTGLAVFRQIGEPGVSSLTKLLRMATSAEHKCKLLTALSDIAGGDATQPIASALRDRNVKVRKTAISILGNVGDVNAVRPLAGMMDDRSEEIRWSAAEALLAIASRDPEAVKPLTDVLERNDLRSVAKNYPFFIKLGKDGTEPTLAKALHYYGNKTMALDYLNCGNSALDEAAHEWASRNGYTVTSGSGGHGGPQWGEGL